MSTTTEILLDHLPAVLDAFKVAGSPTAAYERLKAFPAIATISLSSFRAVASAIVETAQRLHEVEEPVKQEIDNLKEQVTLLTQERDSLQEQLAELNNNRQPVKQENVQPPKTFEGWTVHTNEKGYTRLHKKVNGKVQGIYIGRQWDKAKALERIKAAGLLIIV